VERDYGSKQENAEIGNSKPPKGTFWYGMYTVFIVQVYQTTTELLNMWCRAAGFFSASGAALFAESCRW
jgi:hypothetical protein